jgi:hypothetical protein
MSSNTDDDSVGNACLTTLEVYELHDYIKFKYHEPKWFLRMKHLQEFAQSTLLAPYVVGACSTFF